MVISHKKAVMSCVVHGLRNIPVSGEPLKCVHDFKYPGCAVCNKATSTFEISWLSIALSKLTDLQEIW